MNFSRTNRYKRIPKPFREHSGTQTWKTRERMRTTPRVILILKQASSAARLHKTLAQKIVVTTSNNFSLKMCKHFRRTQRETCMWKLYHSLLQGWNFEEKWAFMFEQRQLFFQISYSWFYWGKEILSEHSNSSRFKQTSNVLNHNQTKKEEVMKCHFI